MSEEERTVTPPEGRPEAAAQPETAAPEVPAPPEVPEPPVVEPPAETPAEETLETPPTAPAVLPPAPSGPTAAEVTSDDRLMAGLAWFSMVILQLPLISVVLLLAEGNKERPYQRYHAITSILFWVAAIVYETIAIVAFTILTVVSLGCLALCLWVIFFLPHLVALYYAFQAYNGKQMEIPVISDFARKQGWV